VTRSATGEAPAVRYLVDRSGVISCPAHAGPDAWRALLDGEPVHAAGWGHVPDGMVADLIRLNGCPVCDECRRARRLVDA